MIFLRKLKHSRKYTPDFWPETPHLQNYYFPFSCCFFLSDNDGSFATDHQTTASQSRRVLWDSWKERLSLLISWCPEAQLPLFSLVKLWLLTCGCFGHPSLLFHAPLIRPHAHSVHPSIHFDRLRADWRSFFVSLTDVCLRCCVLNVWSCILMRWWRGCNTVDVLTT